MNPQRSHSSRHTHSPLAGLAASVVMALAALPAAAQTVSPWQGPASQTRQGELRMGLTRNTQVVYEPRPWQPATPLPTDYVVSRPQASLGLEFKAPRKEGSNLRSLLRVELSSDSFVQFRPRSGGLAVTYKSQF